jgi:hypothetical protein
MKKILTLAVAILMVCALSVGTFAATHTDLTTEKKDSETITVTVTNAPDDGSAAAVVYKVDVAWSEMTMAYKFTGSTQGATWNPGTHKYETVDGSTTTVIDGAWTDDAAKVTVTNHSNNKVTAAVELGSSDYGVTFAVVGEASATLDDAAVVAYGAYDSAPFKVFSIQASGTPDITVDGSDSFSVDATVTITAA